jgi:3-oxoacyl-[acyl-carrier protein] reductase
MAGPDGLLETSALHDRAILVTGSTRGIGHAVAGAVAAHGGIVGVHGRDAGRVTSVCAELAARGARAVPCPGDFSAPEAAPRVVDAFVAQTGRIDGLVNCAGGGKAVAFRGLTLAAWRQTFATNLEAAMLASQAAYVAMRQHGRGAIVNIASLAAHTPGRWMGADYAASKAGLVSLTRSLALEAARLGIRVNAVSPGMVDTEMTAALTDAMRQAIGIPLQRFARPEEIAAAVVFLLGDASGYITGQVLHVDGGLWTGGGT